ncbi:MAG: hypothetical protein M1813_002374 [Trichoglossum hirsutum]|nr:MAG: hypothetical protein M1813_002374 [Trichoglossum hirsutum]
MPAECDYKVAAEKVKRRRGIPTSRTTTEPFGPRIDADGRTSLHSAAILGDDETAQRILSRGVDAKAKEKTLLTALFYAMQNSHRNVALSLARRSNVPDEVVIANLNNSTDAYKAEALFGAIKGKKILPFYEFSQCRTHFAAWLLDEQRRATIY